MTSRKRGADPDFAAGPGLAAEPGFAAVLAFPKFKVAVTTRDGCVAGIRYLPPTVPPQAPRDALAERAARQLERYREDPDAAFDLPLLVEGTAFQKAVWQAMCAIPRGRTRTYGELARELGAEARAVGQACGDNRLPIVIPCHRVVAAQGIGGFGHSTGGYLIEAKRWLLLHEAQADAFALRP
jgi:methylated-DNA-[protein]-cysteine S-methyltransferase